MLGSPKRSALLSGLIHAAAILLIVFATRAPKPAPTPPHVTYFLPVHVGKYTLSAGNKGGGGGARDKTPASKGELPRTARFLFPPPTVVVQNYNPILAIEPAISGPPVDHFTPPLYYGDPNGVDGPPSNGRGPNGGIGDGDGGGVGNATGPGAGDGPCCGISGGTQHLMGTITPLHILSKVEPEYSDEARRARIQGTVVLYIEVSAQGMPQNMQVKQSLGLGLDERAIEAVRKWRFEPARVNGKPIVTSALVEVNFRLL